MQEICKPVRLELEIFETRLAELSLSRNEAIAEAIHEILNAGGKRLRPALLLMAARLCGHGGERAIRMAVVVELIHTASLIHDDVIDNAAMRRGVPTLSARWDDRIAVLAGDHLYSKAVGILAQDGALEVMKSVAAAAGMMTDSEVTEILCRNDVHMTEEQYLSIIAGKTASLISCSCRIGAMLGEAHNGEVEILGDYGLDLGMAFQITDDLIDITGDEDVFGKPLRADVRGGMITLPYIRTLSVAGKKDRQWMSDTVRSRRIDKDAFARMKSMVESYGGIEYSLEKAKNYVGACKRSLNKLEESECQASLAMLADYVADRVA